MALFHKVTFFPFCQMKKLIFLLPLPLLFLFLGFKPDPIPQQLGDQMMQEGVRKWISSLDNMVEQAEAWEIPVGKPEMIRAYTDSRKAFKEIEFLLAYFDPEGVNDYINGAPLLHVERKAPELVVLEPEGYQPLDELLYAIPGTEGKSNIIAIREMVHALRFRGGQLAQSMHHATSQQLLEAIRLGWVRLFTLGLTGFDTPASGLAIEDAKSTFRGMSTFLLPFIQQVEGKNEPLAHRTLSLLGQGKERLDVASGIESFDHLSFLKEIINPLYESTYQVQVELGIEFPSEVNPLPQSINYHATNIFAPDFLNPWYYSKLPQTATPQRVALGERLFFDPILSSTGEMSCSTCHQVEHGFAEPIPKSLAANGHDTLERNSMTLINAVYAQRYFHDLRTDRLDKQVSHVVFSEGEFNTNFKEIAAALNQTEDYPTLFTTAYPELGEDAIGEYSLRSALAYYVQSLRAFNSPFDQYMRGESDDLSPTAKRGFNIFMGKAACATCHFPPLFSGVVPPNYHDTESEVLGVPVAHDTLHPVLDSDPGRIANNRPKESAGFYRYSFKTPTLRNIALTPPYMHNGAYADLETVVDFYDRGGGLGMGMDVPHQTLPATKLNLTAQEKEDLIAFMESLTDTTRSR